MQGLCYSLDKRTGNLPPVKNVKQIHLIGPQLKGKLCQAYSPFPTLLLYNFSYGKVITHRYKYIPRWNICQGEVEEKILHSGIRVKRMKEKEIGQRIRLLRKALNLTQAEFGEKIGRAWNTINRWEAGEREIPDMALKLISQVFGISYEWLKTGQGEMWERKEKTLLEELEAKTRELLEKLVRIPVVGRAGAGFPESPADMDVIGWVLVSKETFQKGGKFSVQVCGDSMEPTLHDGDFVAFKTYVGDGSDIPSGKVVVVRNHCGELIVKRLTRVGGSIVLTSDNPKYPPIPPEQFVTENLRIVGVAVKIVREIEV
jgi:repressor LexA